MVVVTHCESLSDPSQYAVEVEATSTAVNTRARSMIRRGLDFDDHGRASKAGSVLVHAEMMLTNVM